MQLAHNLQLLSEKEKNKQLEKEYNEKTIIDSRSCAADGSACTEKSG